MKILTLSGSLREGSLHTQLCEAVVALVPEGVEVERASIGDLPLFDGDLPRPPAVDRLIRQVEEADAVFIATPEYNYSVPGPLKNALDWASRPAYASCFAGKPVAIASASPGALGGARAQQHLRSILAAMLAPVVPFPELCIGGAHRVLVDGAILDDATRGRVEELLKALVVFARKLA